MKPKDDHLGYKCIIEITNEYMKYKNYSLLYVNKKIVIKNSNKKIQPQVN